MPLSTKSRYVPPGMRAKTEEEQPPPPPANAMHHIDPQHLPPPSGASPHQVLHANGGRNNTNNRSYTNSPSGSAARLHHGLSPRMIDEGIANWRKNGPQEHPNGVNGHVHVPVQARRFESLRNHFPATSHYPRHVHQQAPHGMPPAAHHGYHGSWETSSIRSRESSTTPCSIRPARRRKNQYTLQTARAQVVEHEKYSGFQSRQRDLLNDLLQRHYYPEMGNWFRRYEMRPNLGNAYYFLRPRVKMYSRDEITDHYRDRYFKDLCYFKTMEYWYLVRDSQLRYLKREVLRVADVFNELFVVAGFLRLRGYENAFENCDIQRLVRAYRYHGLCISEDRKRYRRKHRRMSELEQNILQRDEDLAQQFHDLTKFKDHYSTTATLYVQCTVEEFNIDAMAQMIKTIFLASEGGYNDFNAYARYTVKKEMMDILPQLQDIANRIHDGHRNSFDLIWHVCSEIHSQWSYHRNR